ncbi:MAG: PCMD domain-containing protein [Fibrobacter sp.]|nr:PCMD domain-containing protein [Fibrobacter sp.]
MRKLVLASIAALCCLLMVGCSDDSSATPLFAQEEIADSMDLKIPGWKIDSLDKKSKIIRVSPAKNWLDSLVLDSVSLPGCSALYLAADGDLVDPELGEKLVPGTVIPTADTNQVSIVALDSYNRVVGVWLVVWDLPKTPKSSDSCKGSSGASNPGSSISEKSSSSGENPESSESLGSSSESSSNSTIGSSSESASESSSSVEVGSCSSSAEGGSSEGPSSSSATPVPQTVKLEDLDVVNGRSISLIGSKIYVEMPYEADLSQIQLIPLDTTNDLRRPVDMEFEDEEGNVATYTVVAGVQLPGSDFSDRNDFWATTSDAMAQKASASIIANYSSKKNLTFEPESESQYAVLSTYAVSKGITAWKLAGGFYFAGYFSGTDCSYIYKATNDSDSDPADFSQYMSHGQPFAARPSAFEIRYKYVHENNSNETYPQRALIYVVLVSADNKIVASGVITESSTVSDWTSQTVNLDYGSDNGLLSAGYTGFSDLAGVGSGDEDVVSIRVMFASSAFAYVADGGNAFVKDERFRGGENSQLFLDDFKLIY